MAKPVAALITCLLLFSLRAAAQEQDADLAFCAGNATCIQHFGEAQRAAANGQFPQAIAEYQKICAINSSPVLLANLAELYRASGNTVEAIRYYKRYLDQASTGDTGRRELARSYIVESVPLLLPPGELPPRVSEPTVSVSEVQKPLPSVAVRRPLSKRWWIWTLAGVAAAGVITGAVLATYLQPPDVAGIPSTRLVLLPNN